MIMQGIDISHHNYSLIRAKGASYLYDKASLGFVIMKATEGVTFDDPRYNEYVRMIGESNIRYGFACAGAYHYARPENNTALAEAQHFVDRIRPYSGAALFTSRSVLCPLFRIAVEEIRIQIHAVILPDRHILPWSRILRSGLLPCREP